jgi:hypothetical protein
VEEDQVVVDRDTVAVGCWGGGGRWADETIG